MESENLQVELKPMLVAENPHVDLLSQETMAPKITAGWKDLSYSVPAKRGKRHLLRGLSGTLLPGEMTAIIGPSGAGKTTFLNTLSGFDSRNRHQVELFVNGESIKEKSFRKLSTYVMNGDHLMPYLTVRETVEMATRLKLPEALTYQKRAALVNSILELWNLDTCENRAVRLLSSGQRKRVTLAQELVNNPSLIFLDEPTSGLDSSNTLQCILTLKQFAAKGHAIACSIHQPSSRLFQLFDRIYVLADGFCIYHGTVREVVPFLKSNGFQCPQFYNPADFLIELASGDYGDVKGDLVRSLQRNEDSLASSPAAITIGKSGDEKQDPLEVTTTGKYEGPKNGNTASFGLQIRVLLKRACLSIIRNPMVFHLRLATHIVVAVLMGLLYYGIGDQADSIINNASLVFFCIIFLTFTGMMPVVVTYPLEASIFVRERCNNWYTLKAYYLASTIVEIPFQIAHPTIFVAIVYWMTSQPPDCYRFVVFVILNVLLSLVAHSLGMLFGAAASVQTAVFLAPVTAIPMLLFSGFVVTLRAMPWYLHWVSYVSFVRYTYEGGMQIIYSYNRTELQCTEDDNAAPCLFTMPQDFLDFLGLNETTVETCAMTLLAYIVFLKVAAYFALRWRIKHVL